MTASRFTAVLSSLASLVLATAVSAQSAQQPQARLSAPIVDTARAALPGSQPPRARLARDLGAVDSSTPLPHITLFFSRTAQQQADLESLLAAEQNPSSPEFHQWLTPAEFGARFGVADADIAKTEAWLQSQGFTILSVAPSRNSITFSGTAAAAASAFGAPIHRYSYNGENHIAPSADLTLPAALSGIVADVRGLSDFRPHPRVKHATSAAVHPNFTSSQTGNHFLTPGDVAVIYDIKPAYNAGYNGSGQTIAVMGQSAVSMTDITNFQTAIGQTAKAPTAILVPGTGVSTVYSGDESESDLDLEYSSGIAPGATVNFVYVGAEATASVFDALTWAVQNRIASILNISYGQCEPLLGQSEYSSLNAILQQAAAQGQTVVSAAGDDGSTDCFIGSEAAQEEGIDLSVSTEQAPAVDFPSSSQYVTGVGGTEFLAADVAATTGTTQYWQGTSGSDVVVSALSYIPEQVWNDDAAELANGANPLEYGRSAGGGGVSIYTPAPSWQTGVPGIPSGAANRFVPDIALDASPNNAPYAYCSSDQTAWVSGQASSCSSGLRDSSTQDLTFAGGTSFAAPIFSGMVAILGQARGYTQGQGVVNPMLYSLAANPTTYASAFHDITSGSNACNLGATYCGTGPGSTDYSAGVGYDEASGLGSIDLNNLLTAWPKNTSTTTAPGFTLSGTAVSVSETSSTSAVSGTSTITATPTNGYTGTIQWTVAASATVFTNSAGTQVACYSISNTSVTGSSAATATLTVTTGNTYNAATGTASCPSGTKPLGLAQSASSNLRADASTPPPTDSSRAVPALAGFGIVSLGLITLLPPVRRKRLPTLLAVLILAGVGLGLSGCGGSNTSGVCAGTCGGGGGTTNPTTESYTITVIGTDTATSSITAQTTIPFTLTVQ